MEVVPLLFLQQPMHYLPLLFAHLEDFVFEPVLAIGAEILYVNRIFADELIDLRSKRWRISEIVLRCIRREKTSDADAINPPRRIIRRHTNDNRALALSRQL